MSALVGIGLSGMHAIHGQPHQLVIHQAVCPSLEGTVIENGGHQNLVSNRGCSLTSQM